MHGGAAGPRTLRRSLPNVPGVLFPGCLLVSRVIDEHRLYLRDRHRVSAYERALREVVRPGDIVVDLASGTGILGMLACRAGARRVYAIEEGGIAGLARQIARANGFEDRITSVRGNSRLVTLPERADVVVCDQIGGFGLEAGIFELAKDVRQRFLRPGGTFVPSAVELVVAPVEHPRLARAPALLEGTSGGFRLLRRPSRSRPTPAIRRGFGLSISSSAPVSRGDARPDGRAPRCRCS